MKLTKGQVAYVSGAGSGIGRGVALAFAARGLKVGVCDIRAEDAEETVALIEAQGGEGLAIVCDVSDASAVEDAAAAIEAAFGPVTIVHNNAGVAMHGTPLHEITSEEWDWVIDVNVRGGVHGIRAFVPRLLAADAPGHIVNTASIGGFQVNPGFLTGAYSMTKYAVVALSEALRNELADTPIGISVLAPAAVETDLHLSARARPDRFGGPTTRPENHPWGM